MSTVKLREIERVPDQRATLAKMIAKDHAAGRHTLPLPKCGECGETVYTNVAGSGPAKPLSGPREIGTPEEMSRWQAASKAAFSPRRSKKAPVPQVVEQVVLPITEPHVEYPRDQVGRPKPQTTRMLKLQCPDCGYTVRTTQKWIAVGLPSCPAGDELEVAK